MEFCRGLSWDPSVFISDLEEVTSALLLILKITSSWAGAVCKLKDRTAILKNLGRLEEVRLTEVLENSTRLNAKSCTWEGRTTHSTTGQALAAWDAALWKTAGRQAEVIMRLDSSLTRPCLDTASSFGTSNRRKAPVNWSELSGVHQDCQGSEHLACKRD